MKYSPGGRGLAEGTSLRWRAGTRTAAAVAAGGLLLSSAGLVYADELYNKLDGSIDSTAEVMPLNVGGPNGSTKIAVNPTNEDPGKQGCNLTGQSTLTVEFRSSAPTKVSVVPSIATFTACGSEQQLFVVPVAEGSADITAHILSNTTSGNFDLAPATFTVNVTKPTPTNTAPQLSVNGVVTGASYTKGAVPAATCSVVDAEDGNKSFPATLSATSGPDGATGIGTQEASCRYTDKGGLNVASSVTYNIVDGTGPDVTYTLSPAEADGLGGWYKSAVTLDWTVTDADSPSTIRREGCEKVTVALDQLSAGYTCSASSSGGPATPVTVSIKKDGTAPLVEYTSPAGRLGNEGWYTSDVVATFTGNDDTSGLTSPTQTATTTGEGAAVTVGSPAFTDIAGNTTRSGSATSDAFKIDKTAPRVSFTGATTEPNEHGWYNTDVEAIFTGTDDVSGPASVTDTAKTSGEGDNLTAASPAFQDVAGNTTAAGAATSAAYKVDKTAPTVSYDGAVTGTMGKNDWYTSDVDVTFGVADALSGVESGTRTVTSEGEDAEVRVASPAVEDLAGNVRNAGAAAPTFKIDKTAPTVRYAGEAGTKGSNGWYTSDVEVTFDVSDLTSGVEVPTHKVTSQGEGPGVEVVSPAVEDRAGNVTGAGAVTRSYNIDKKAPTVTFDSVLGDSYFGSTPAAPTCTATDNEGGSGIAGSCTVTGYSTSVDTHMLYATATDFAGNETTVTQAYEVKPWTLKGFYQPVDMSGVWNTVKGGSTVPAKFEAFVGDTELTDPARMKFTAAKVTCNPLAPEDAIEVLASGSTSLRYDALAGQFVYNWKTPTGAGNCYRLTLTADDGTSISANFKLK